MLDRRQFLTATAILFAARPAFAQSRPVSIALDWTPNTNHVGLFVAQAKAATLVPLCRFRRAGPAPELHRLKPVLSRQEPATATDFITATKRGYAFAVDHPDEATDMLIAANGDALTNLTLVRASLQAPIDGRHLKSANGHISTIGLAKMQAMGSHLFDDGIFRDGNGDAVKACPDFSRSCTKNTRASSRDPTRRGGDTDADQCRNELSCAKGGIFATAFPQRRLPGNAPVAGKPAFTQSPTGKVTSVES